MDDKQYTREELVEIVRKAIKGPEIVPQHDSFRGQAKAALSALESLGAVKIKGGV